jgi:hypothetical protein
MQLRNKSNQQPRVFIRQDWSKIEQTKVDRILKRNGVFVKLLGFKGVFFLCIS